MKNILKEKPETELNARLKESIKLVSDRDIKNKNVLDIGCGYGWFELNALSKGVKSITGMEISKEDLSTIKNNIKDKRLILKVGSAIDLPFKDKSFDTVVCWEVIEHIPKDTENKMFSEVYRVLKTGGNFYLSTPYNHIVTNLFDPAWWLIGHRHYSKKQFYKYAKYNNFLVSIFKVKGRIWSSLSIVNLYFSKWILRRKPIFSFFFTKMENFEYNNDSGFVNIFAKFIKK